MSSNDYGSMAMTMVMAMSMTMTTIEMRTVTMTMTMNMCDDADDDNGDHEYNDDGWQRYEENTNMDDDDDGRQKHIYVTAQERNGCHLNTESYRITNYSNGDVATATWASNNTHVHPCQCESRCHVAFGHIQV